VKLHYAKCAWIMGIRGHSKRSNRDVMKYFMKYFMECWNQLAQNVVDALKVNRFKN